MNVFYLKGVNQSMKQFIQWLATKNFILVDLMLIASMGVLLYASWPSLQSYSRWTAIALLAIMVVLAVIGLGALVIQVAFMTKRKAIDLRVYEQQQLSLPLPSLHTTKIAEEDAISASVPRKSLPRSRHVLQRLQKPRSANSQVLQPAKNSATPANLQRANLQKPFATGYRPPSNAVANPQSANLQPVNDGIIKDEVDAKIAEAARKLRQQNIKPTGIAIANMTGIAQRTVYDRMTKITEREIKQ